MITCDYTAMALSWGDWGIPKIPRDSNSKRSIWFGEWLQVTHENVESAISAMERPGTSIAEI